MQSISTERRPVSLSVTFMGASIYASRREYPSGGGEAMLFDVDVDDGILIPRDPLTTWRYSIPLYNPSRFPSQLNAFGIWRSSRRLRNRRLKFFF
jgi:hypothetical protein